MLQPGTRFGAYEIVAPIGARGAWARCIAPHTRASGATKTVHPLAAAVSGLTGVIASPDGALACGYHRDASQVYVIKGLK